MATTSVSNTDPYNLTRFVTAQEPVIGDAIAEISAGKKVSHWMWFVFPQVDGLGKSATSQQYAITTLAEAKAYLAHPLLGPRIRQCAKLAMKEQPCSITDIFGDDGAKFLSSMTLFAQLAERDSVFAKAVQRYFNGVFDPETISWISKRS